MKEITEGYAVQVTREDGSVFLSSGSDAGRAFFRKWSGALKWKQSLSEHISKRRLKIVKARMVITWSDVRKSKP